MRSCALSRPGPRLISTARTPTPARKLVASDPVPVEPPSAMRRASTGAASSAIRRNCWRVDAFALVQHRDHQCMAVAYRAELCRRVLRHFARRRLDHR